MEIDAYISGSIWYCNTATLHCWDYGLGNCSINRVKGDWLSGPT